MNKGNMPRRKEEKRRSALERRLADVSKHTASGDKVKAEKAKSDVEGLKKKLGMTTS